MLPGFVMNALLGVQHVRDTVGESDQLGNIMNG